MELINISELKEKTLKVVKEDGSLQVYDKETVFKILEETNNDLVRINNSTPYIYKILDYKKYLYDKKKKEKQNTSKIHKQNLKELKFSLSIAENDINTKVKNAEKFLRNNDKVKIIIELRGREVVHNEQALLLIDKIVSKITNGEKDSTIKNEGKRIYVVLKQKNKI